MARRTIPSRIFVATDARGRKTTIVARSITDALATYEAANGHQLDDGDRTGAIQEAGQIDLFSEHYLPDPAPVGEQDDEPAYASGPSPRHGFRNF